MTELQGTIGTVMEFLKKYDDHNYHRWGENYVNPVTRDEMEDLLEELKNADRLSKYGD